MLHHVHVPFSWPRELVGVQPQAKAGSHRHKHSLSPREWRSCSCLKEGGGRKEVKQSITASRACVSQFYLHIRRKALEGELAMRLGPPSPPQALPCWFGGGRSWCPDH